MIFVVAKSLPPDTQTQLVQALHYTQLWVSQGYYYVQDTLNTLWHGLQRSYWPRTLPKVVHNTTWHGAGMI